MAKKLTLAEMTPDVKKQEGIAVDAMKPYDTEIRKATVTEVEPTKPGIGNIVRTDFK